jgi:hypothetical protein
MTLFNAMCEYCGSIRVDENGNVFEMLQNGGFIACPEIMYNEIKERMDKQKEQVGISIAEGCKRLISAFKGV